MPPDNHNQSNSYDFFMNNQHSPKKPALLSGNRSFKQRIIIVVGGGLLLIILVIIGAAFIGGTPNTASLTTLAQQQNELITLSGSASTLATQPTTQNLAVNINLGLTTEQQTLLAYLKTHGDSVSSKTLSVGNSATATSQLTAATSAGNYDSVFIQLMQSQLSSYSSSLKQIYMQSSSVTQRQLLNTDYIDAQILIDQANSSASSLGSA